MEQLARAIATTQKLQAALEAEVERAQGERHLIRRFDVPGLLASAQKRGEFNVHLAGLEKALQGELATVGEELGITEVTLEALRAHAPEATGRLSLALSEVRARAAALRELDDLNRKLAQRASACVRGYLGAVLPAAPSAYDRRGEVARPGATTFHGRA
jgi:hypothetical protein